ncbi:hypothetical protein HDU97_009146, partial [Phlyctochytrium planicorne]
MVEAVDSTESFVPDQPPLFCRGNEQLVERLARGIAFHVKPNLNYKLSSVEDSGFVKLADSSTLLPIKGYGDVVIDFGGHKHIIRNALHVPDLAETLGSVRSLIGNSNDGVIFERDAVMLEIANSNRSGVAGTSSLNLSELAKDAFVDSTCPSNSPINTTQ